MICHQLTKRIHRLGDDARSFCEELYQEHLEEISCLYEQKMMASDDPYYLWPDLEFIENRIDAHIEALVAGEVLALDVCRNTHEKNDPGVLYAMVRLFCRQKNSEGMDEVLEQWDAGNQELRIALTHACVRDLPAEWSSFVDGMLSSGNPGLIRVGADVAGIRRFSLEDGIIAVSDRHQDAILPEVIRAMGRLGIMEARYMLRDFVENHEDDEVRFESYLALLRLKDKGWLQNDAVKKTWADTMA